MARTAARMRARLRAGSLPALAPALGFAGMGASIPASRSGVGPHAELRTDPRSSPGQVPAHGERPLPGLRPALAGPGPPAPEHLPVRDDGRGRAPLPAGQHGDRAD